MDKVRFASTDINTIAAILANPARAADVSEFGSGALIFETLQVEGAVAARMLLEWWLAEDAFVRLRAFMDSQFNGRALLLERSGTHSFRYRIRQPEAPAERNATRHADKEDEDGDDPSNALSEIFAKIESHKEMLQVQEYSVGQTTLEQIFNQFASQSDNPEVAMQAHLHD